MLLIFGGTTEGKQAIQLMNELNQSYHYSTKTKVDYTTDGLGIYRYGALDAVGLSTYINQHRITEIIDAAHPFATTLHQTIAEVSQSLSIPVYRLERMHTNRQEHSLIHYVDTYADALELLSKRFSGKKLLALSGVQSIPRLNAYWKAYPTIFRILNRPSSIAIAEKHQFPMSQLILAYPNKELEKEIAIYQEHQIEVILTKESGNSGYLTTKINAALALDIPILILKKPTTPESFQVVDHLEKLKAKLLQ